MVMWPTKMLWDAVDASLSGKYVPTYGCAVCDSLS